MGEPHHLTARRFDEQPRLQAMLDDDEQLVLADLPRRRPDVERHVVTDDRRGREQPLFLIGQPRHPPLDHLAQQGRQCPAGQLAQLPASAFPRQRATFLQGAQELADEERVALRAPLRAGGEARGSASGSA